MELPQHLRYPVVLRTHMRDGVPYACDSTTGDKNVEEFVLRAERINVLRNRDMPQEEVDNFFRHLLDKTILDAFETGEQIEPWRTLVRGAIPQYIMEFDITDERTLNRWHLAIATEATITRRAWERIGFEVLPDPDIGDLVLNRGRIIVPVDGKSIAYTYKASDIDKRTHVSFERDSRTWESPIRAREELRSTRELETLIAVNGPSEYDVARTVLPLFTMRYPDFKRPWADE